MSDEREALRRADAALVAAAKDIKVLTHLSWPDALRSRFLEAWRAGRRELPQPPPVDSAGLSAREEALEQLSKPVSEHPLARFVARTAGSYRDAIRLLQQAGTPGFTELSIKIYGGPQEPVLPGSMSSLAAAEHFCATTAELASTCHSAGTTPSLDAEQVAAQLRARLAGGLDALQVVIEPRLAAKAAAGAERIRIRADASFSEHDVDQLLEHEALVHSATALNGRLQPNLGSLSLGAPRTTATQEGLATFAELITTRMDLARLRRVALRIVAVQRALEGADFLEVFQFFLESGYDEDESYASTQRVFRGGDVRGGVPFTKDVVYLRGLLRTHVWFHTALGERKVDYPRWLFAGRLTWFDVEELAPFFEEGALAPPRYEPAWIARRDNLAAYLALMNLTHLLPVAETQLTDFKTQRLARPPGEDARA